jgi:DNA polymerase-1
MDIDKLKAVVESLRTVEVKEVFPPVGDAHAITAAAVFPEAKDAFLGRKVMHRKRRVEVEGAEAKAYYKEELRATAKMIGLAIPYGGTGYTVASRLGVSQSEGDEIVSNILAGNPMVGRYIQARRSQVRREKKVASIFGRIRYLPDIDSKNNKKVYLSERLAFNAPVQMSGAEQLKLILLRIGFVRSIV